ncbi:MAG: ABC transporter ATP-binding protein [Firmicutes bacterium]|nr:ABC transporter ATP-binding protein [Bacillota bacterium]
MALLELKGITKDYYQGSVRVPALRGIDLSIDSGEFTSIAGPSGSGKTTLLNLIGCLDNPTSGEITLEGRPLADLTKRELADVRREKIGFIFQSYNLIPVLTAYENVEFALAMQGTYSPQELRKRVIDILDAVGLEGLYDRKPQDLSGGQQQRVAIARALVKEPKLILADEPTANLDSETGKSIIQLMQRMNQEKNVTFIFSTHDPMVMEHARRLITVKDGRIEADERR